MPTPSESLVWDLTRAGLKKLFGGRDRLYTIASVRAPDISRVEDNFTGPVIDTNKWTVNNGGGASAASPAIDVGLKGGAIKMVTGTAGDSTASSMLAGGRHFTGQTNAVIIARVQITTVVTGVKVEIGFRDAITNAAIVNVKSTPTFTATDGCCWIYDTNHTGTGWNGLGVAGGTAATSINASSTPSYDVAPVATTYEYLQVSLVNQTAYYSHYNVDGVRDFLSSGQLLAVTAATLLSPHIYIEARNATSKTLNVDWVMAYDARTTTP